MKQRLGGNYWRLWGASVVSNLGDGVSSVALPWLASAVTRNPVHIALVGVAARIPWLVFSLPAGVIADRVDRRRLMAWMDGFRFLVALGLAAAVGAASADLSTPAAIAAGAAEPPPQAALLLGALYAAALLLGIGEVLRDNAAQTVMPAVVEPELLERANERLWGAEMVMNSFVGPPLGGALIAVAFALPFATDAATFAVSAVLVASMTGRFSARADDEPRTPLRWRAEIGEGIRWLWEHRLLRTMGLILGVMNAVLMAVTATYVLFVQEILGLEAAAFGALLTAGAVGGVVGSLFAERLSRLLGSGTALFAVLGTQVVTLTVTGLTSSAVVVWGMFVAGSFVAVVWNVITVSLRQAIIPDRLLGRVNSVYRLFAWGMMPVGTFAGGVMVDGVAAIASREAGLRAPFLVGAGIFVVLLVYAIPRLNTRRIEAARAAVKESHTPPGDLPT